MVLKKIMVEKTRRCCDFCGQNEDKIDVSICVVCKKDVCEKCKTQIKYSEYDYLIICPDCKDKDLSEYAAIAITIAKMYEDISKLTDRQWEILEDLKRM